jgi:hypothetical protein
VQYLIGPMLNALSMDFVQLLVTFLTLDNWETVSQVIYFSETENVVQNPSTSYKLARVSSKGEVVNM